MAKKVKTIELFGVIAKTERGLDWTGTPPTQAEVAGSDVLIRIRDGAYQGHAYGHPSPPFSVLADVVRWCWDAIVERHAPHVCAGCGEWFNGIDHHCTAAAEARITRRERRLAWLAEQPTALVEPGDEMADGFAMLDLIEA